MNKLLLIIAVLAFSFNSNAQTKIEKPLVDTLGIKVNYNDNGSYILLIHNSKYKYYTDMNVKSFSSKADFVQFLDTLIKYSSAENWSESFKGSTIKSIINGTEHSFSLTKNEYTHNTNYAAESKEWFYMSKKDRKVKYPNEEPQATFNTPSIQLSLYFENGFSLLQKNELVHIKNKLVNF